MTSQSNRPRIYPQLGDTDWLRQQRSTGRTALDIASELGCSDRAVGKALRVAGITPRPRGGLSPWGSPHTRRLSTVAVRTQPDITKNYLAGPPMRPQPVQADDVLVVRVDRGWTSRTDRAVLLVEPHHTLHQLAMTIVGFMAYDADTTHLGGYVLTTDGRIVAPRAAGYRRRWNEARFVPFGAGGLLHDNGDGWDDDVVTTPHDDTVASTLGAGHACWLVWDLGDKEMFSVRVLASAPASDVDGLGAPTPQGIHLPTAARLGSRMDAPVIPTRWSMARGEYCFVDPLQ